MSSRERNTFNEINITPLTDIFLVLLIIMMVIAPLLDQQGLNLAVPNNVEVQDIKNEHKLINKSLCAFVLAGAEGFEPSARGFGDRCSTS